MLNLETSRYHVHRWNVDDLLAACLPHHVAWSEAMETSVSMIFFSGPKNSEENRYKQAAMLVTYRHTSYSCVVFSTPRIRLSLRGWFRYDKQWSKNWSQHFVSGYPSHHESMAGSPCWKPPTMELAGGPQGAWRYACYFVGFDRNCPNLTRTEGREERRYEEMMDDSMTYTAWLLFKAIGGQASHFDSLSHGTILLQRHRYVVLHGRHSGGWAGSFVVSFVSCSH